VKIGIFKVVTAGITSFAVTSLPERKLIFKSKATTHTIKIAIIVKIMLMEM
jgi:hypothetical protein